MQTCDEKVGLLVSQNDTDQIAELKETEEHYCDQEDNTVPFISCASEFPSRLLSHMYLSVGK